MAMTKKEQEALEIALTSCSLRATSEILPDVIPPTSYDELSKGFAIVAISSESARVEPACSSSVYHGIGSQEETSSQRAISLYSTKLLALKALRYRVEQDCAKRLRRIDKMIEQEMENKK